jgi:hypothetical protein
MDILFKALPRDLQWEILTAFVGSHVVRFNKLRRKIVFTKIDGRIMRQQNDQTFEIANLVRKRVECLPWLTAGMENPPDYVRITDDNLRDKPFICCRDRQTNNTIYLYRKIWSGIPLFEVNFDKETDQQQVLLPLFEKQKYMSYPYTNKKLNR